eukprot:m.260540 g.260540  ORF g.260540 m.260540 type:complete len:1806 (-) comp22741_c1_seq1:25-5442(-)
MTTRLDRLLQLLEQGSTPATRKAAAQQIGEVQKYHPHDLQQLLRRVHTCLRSRVWEARIAASQAIEAIARNVPQWTPPSRDPSEGSAAPAKREADDDEEEEAEAAAFSFETFDLESVIAHGAPLLGSSGKEYSLNDTEGLSAQERLRRQRNNIQRQLGLAGKDSEVQNFLVNEDLSVSTDAEQQRQRKREEEERLNKELSGLSARERNRALREAKRKSKTASREAHVARDVAGSAAAARTQLVTEQTDASKVVVESKVDAVELFASKDEWPFQPRAEELCFDLFSSHWEIRHGACLGLREMIKLHGTGAGKRSGATPAEMEQQNRVWLADMAIRFVCVLTLDRFGDFMSDQVVAPVRDTCAQALGAVLKCMQHEDVEKVLDLLLKMLHRPQWEIRHGSLLGIKYLVAIRPDLVGELLPRLLPAILAGLEADDDDVRAAAAEAMQPIVGQIVLLAPKLVGGILESLWSALLELDDLTASTGSVLRLLATMLSQDVPAVRDTMTQAALENLAPRLWPFFRHTLSSVRMAVLDALRQLVTARTSSGSIVDIPSVVTSALRHLFQNILLEERGDLQLLSCDVWATLVEQVQPGILLGCAESFCPTWMTLLCTPAGVPMSPKLLFMAKASRVDEGSEKRKQREGKKRDTLPALVGGPSQAISPDPSLVIAARMKGAFALGLLLSRLQLAKCPMTFAENVLQETLRPNSAVKRMCSAFVLGRWASNCFSQAHPLKVDPSLLQLLHMTVAEETAFAENSDLVVRMRGEAERLCAVYLEAGVPQPEIAALGPCSAFSVDMALGLANTISLKWDSGLTAQVQRYSNMRKERLRNIVQDLQVKYVKTRDTVRACLASSIVQLHALPETLTPVIKPLVDSLKKETEAALQEHSATALSVLLTQTLSRPKCPNEKIIKNVCKMLVQDPTVTPNLSSSECAQAEGILTLVLSAQREAKEAELRQRKSAKRKQAAASEESDDIVAMVEDTISSQAAEDALRSQSQEQLQRRGAEMAFQAFATLHGAQLLQALPDLWLLATSHQTIVTVHPGSGLAPIDAIQELVNSMQVLEAIAASAHSDISPHLLQQMTFLCQALSYPCLAVRAKAATCIAEICARSNATVGTMTHVLQYVVPNLGDLKRVVARQGAAECLYHVVQRLNIDVVPYIVLLVIPILGRMSDFDSHVRQIVSATFATLIRLMPLESGVPNPPEMPSHLITQKESQREFLEQLLDPSKLQKYTLPIPIRAELRSYQQAGLDWMNFLKKYQLHGILCDDMGLGKTLQSICIMASDNFDRRMAHAANPTADNQPLPNLVVCPPTLVSHWYFETQKFCDELEPLRYSGNPDQRCEHRRNIGANTLVIASYDVVRNDVEFFSALRFNYCVLDEGHIIKNAKSKTTIAVKQVQANHRLILSGTPIQNNVLELWSLFDFLMPGFLGTERQFNEMYSKPILASRDAKASSKAQESGTLALEALHRQVLPFLLRRLKEDVLDDLPPKIIQDLQCELSPLQRQLYESYSQAQAEGVGSQPMHAFQALQYFRSVCNHPLLVLKPQHPLYPRVMDDLASRRTTLNDIQHSTKLVALRQLLLDCGIGKSSDGDSKKKGDDIVNQVGQHRVLLFMQQKSMLDIVERDLFRALMPSVTFLRLDGSTPSHKRHELVVWFNDDPTIDVLMLTTQVGGLGLNLTGADTVIFFDHDWNPMKDLQAMDRAHRIGQKKVVNVYRLITRGTVEEKVMSLQRFKLNIANTVVSQENASLSSMGTSQVLDLFKFSSDDGGKPPQPAASSEGPSSLKDILSSMGEQWDGESQYEDLNMDSFLASMK